MVGDDAQRDVGLVVGAVLDIRHVEAAGNQRAEEVRVEVGSLALQHGREALEARAGIDRGARKRRERAALIAVVLHEDEVPQLDVAAAVARELAVGVTLLARARPKVVMDFRARTARSGLAHGPEVVLLVQAEDAVARDANILRPDRLGFVVLAEHGDVKLVLRNGEILGDQLPGPRDRFLLEIVAKGKIPEHLEERVMAGGAPDLFEVVVLASGAHALLHRAGARVVTLLAPQEHVLELVHTGVREEQRGVVRGHERRRPHHAVPARAEEFEEAAADFVRGHSAASEF